MTKREYAEAVAEKINGKVVETEKANGVIMTGVSPTGDNRVSPVVYIDKAYDHGLSVEQAAAEILDSITTEPDINVDFVKDYDKVKTKLNVALYNKLTKAPISKSAVGYGFSDLILVPYISINLPTGQLGTIKVNPSLLEQWNKTEDEVFTDALENMTFELVEMSEMLKELHNDEIEFPKLQMYVVTNTARNLGAACVIKARAALHEIFPDGYYVIPSSIHEVIVISRDNSNTYTELINMINDVNATQLSPEEVLSDKPYLF